MSPDENKLIYWLPRLMAALFVLFLAAFSLDVFSGNYGFWGTLLALLIHNIPAIVLLVLVIISWKHEMVGAVSFFTAGLAYIVLLMFSPFIWQKLVWALQISGLAWLVGILFLVGWRRKKTTPPTINNQVSLPK